MADFGEYIPVDAVFANGETGSTMHNQFSVLWAKLNRQAIEEAGKLGEIMFFMRAGAAGLYLYLYCNNIYHVDSNPSDTSYAVLDLNSTIE